jgi:hypothetical protein
MWKPLMLGPRAGMARAALAGAAALAGVLVLAQAAPATAVLAPEWHVQFPPDDPGAIASGLNQVSCASASFCLAVGGAEDSGSVFPSFAETWNGSGWTVRNTPNAKANVLDGVSCRSRSDCIAVGDIAGSAGRLLPLAERWNGSGWTRLSTPAPAGAVRSFLTSVSCPSATFCMAVGFWAGASGKQQTLAESWHGGAWKISATLSPPGFRTMQLSSVSCGTASSCVAVGDLLSHGYALLAESWNGHSWRRDAIASPAGHAGGFLADVSCYSPAGCMATGDYTAGTANVPLAERWTGKKWVARTAAVPAASGSGLTGGVSCPSASACTATGFKVQGGRTKLLAERWNGQKWTTQDIKAPPGSENITELSGVSCPAASRCLAVGSYTSSSATENDLGEEYA